MKLDTKSLRYLSQEDWRVLTAVETGSRNHEVVPTPLIAQLSAVRGGVQRCISTLAKVNLIAKVKNAKYDGYRLTYGGLDYLSLHMYQKQNIVYSVGNQIGVGKESDIVVVANQKGEQHVLKIHRLGRISFRTVKTNRDYLRKRNAGSWMYMSRLAAMKEFAFMKALWEKGMPVPQPIGQNRHTIVMSLIDAFPLRQISSVPDPASLYGELIDLIIQLASIGLIHGDYNEFNILIKEETEGEDTTASTDGTAAAIKLRPIIIDFPQMVSIDHANAEYYFNRDVECIKRYFKRRFHFSSDEPGPFFEDARAKVSQSDRLDVQVEASGFSRKMAKDLEKYMKEHGIDGDGTIGEDGNRIESAAKLGGEEDEEEDGEEDEDDDDGDDDAGGDAEGQDEDAEAGDGEDDGEGKHASELDAYEADHSQAGKGMHSSTAAMGT